MNDRTLPKYFCVYVLESEKDGNWYTGYSEDLRRRLNEHFDGKVPSTRNRRPLKLVYWEGSLNRLDATTREKYLKTAWGKRYLRNRMRNYLTG